MKKIACILLGFLLGGCAQDMLQDRPLDEIYNEAMDNMLSGYYQKAAQTFEDVERQYPYNHWAKKSQVMAGYCYYMSRKSEQAVGILEAFSKMHPSHELTPYATYLLGVIHYGRISSPKRDHKVAEEALKAFDLHVKKFPKSIYVDEATKRMITLKEVLAAKEIEVGRYYQQQESYIAALMRFQSVVEKHSESTCVPEAYYRMVEVFLSFGDVDRAYEIVQILEKKHRDTLWLRKSQELVKRTRQK